MSAGTAKRIRFGAFEVVAGELRKNGRAVRLQDQPFRILKSLLARPGEVVTREELRKEIWGEDVYVDFDRSLNTAVARLREALGDSPTRPQFVETVLRRGYRFIESLEPVGSTSLVEKTPQGKRWGVALAIAGLLAAVTLALLWPERTDVELPRSLLNAKTLTGYLGIETTLTLSPDGTQVAFVWNGPDSDNFDIYVLTVGGSQPMRLTHDAREDYSPAWSPDGGLLAFLRQLSGDRSEVLRTPPLGGREEKLTEIYARPENLTMNRDRRYLAWHPSGEHLVLVDRERQDGLGGLYRFALRSGEKRAITSAQTKDLSPAVSPDGKTLAFMRFDAGNPLIHILPLNEDLEPAGRPSLLTDAQFGWSGPAWSADGTRLVVAKYLYRHSLWSLAVDDERRVKEVSQISESGSLPAIARLGGTLVYTRSTRDTNLWRYDISGAISSATAASARGMRVTAATGRTWFCDYSPDGTRIAYNADNRDWISNSDGTHRTPLIPFEMQGGAPKWSPDGTRIAFDSRHGGDANIWIVRTDGGPPSQFTNDPSHDVIPTWSRDGKWIYFGSNRTGEYQIWKKSVEGDQLIQVTEDGGLSGFETPDGSAIILIKKATGAAIWAMNLNTGREKEVVDNIANMADFAVHGEGIYYIKANAQGPGGTVQLYRFSDGSTSTLLEVDGTPADGLSVSPDGRFL